MLDISLFRTGEIASAALARIWFAHSMDVFLAGAMLDDFLINNTYIVCDSADKGGDPEIVRKSQRERYNDVSLVDRVLELDEKWRQGGWIRRLLRCTVSFIFSVFVWMWKRSRLFGAERGNLDTLKMDFNKLTNEIKQLRIVRA